MSELTDEMHMQNSVRKEEDLFKAFCEGARVAINHDKDELDHPAEFGGWLQEEYSDWRAELYE